MGCKHDLKTCLNCEREKCILDEVPEEKEEPVEEKPNRKTYQHDYYLKRKEKDEKDNVCKFCGKVVSGEMIRINKKNFCGIDCVLCYLYDKNEKKMQIVRVGAE